MSEYSRPYEISVTAEIQWKLARIAEAENRLRATDPMGGTITSSAVACRILDGQLQQQYPLLDEYWKNYKQAKEDAIAMLTKPKDQP